MLFIDALWYIDSALETDISDPLRHKYLNLPCCGHRFNVYIITLILKLFYHVYNSR